MKQRYLFLVLMAGLVFLNACQQEYSFENGNGPSVGTLQDDGTGDCLPKTVSGAYVAGTALDPTTNYIEVQANVATPGVYTIYTDTVNGMYFRVSGVFSTAGIVTVRLKGNGTPLAVGVNNFIVHYGTSGCTIAVTTVGTLATFTLDGAPGGCMGAVVNGTYTAGTVLTSSNTVVINVNVTAVGAYTIQTAPSNGMVFTGSGTFTIPGSQAITLTASGTTPISPVSTTIPVNVGTSGCSFTVDVGGGAVFTVDCASSTVNGTYTAGINLTPSANTITLHVNVTTLGAYSITTTPVDGITFSANGTFTLPGDQTVTLAASSGPPTSAGPISVVLTSGGGCTFPVTVAPGAGAATFTINCPATMVNGTYTAGTALTSANTVTLSVDVTVAGTYSISTTPINGMTFSGTGTLAVGTAQQVTLVASPTATPTTATPTTVSIMNSTCTFVVNVQAAALSDYFPRTTNSNWSYEYDNVSTDSSFFKVIAPTVTVAGNTYNVFMATADGITFDTAGYYRRSGSDYYHYVDLADYLGLDNTQRVEFIFIKDNQAVNVPWYSAPYTNAAGGTPLIVRIKFTIVQPNATITITPASGTPVSYPNTIVVQEQYEVSGDGITWQSADAQVGFYKDYYSKNIGWIKDEYYSSSVTTPDHIMVMRRFMVY